MKITRSHIAVAFFLLFSFTLIARNNAHSPEQTIRKRVAMLLHYPELSKNGINKAEAVISFTINEDREVVVLNVITKYEFLKNFIEERLNKKKVKAENKLLLKSYTIRVSFETEKKI